MDESAGDSIGAPIVKFKSRGTRPGGNTRKRPVPPPSPVSQPPDSDDDGYSSDDSPAGSTAAVTDRGLSKKRRRVAGGGGLLSASTASRPHGSELFSTVYAADRDAPLLTRHNDATKHSDWYDETAATVAAAATRGFGPTKAPPTNVRMITLTDYCPDICKDYQKSGFCGFGDSCKFIHDRGNDKRGWQLDREWDDQVKEKNKLREDDGSQMREQKEAEATQAEAIPLTCAICEQPHKTPIVTKCGHYFCEPCALNRYRKSPTCAVCGVGTNGSFKSVKALPNLSGGRKDTTVRDKH